MSIGIRPGWRGLPAPVLSAMGWISPSQILTVSRDGQYSIPSSLSSNAPGIVCARIQYPSGKALWLEYREAINQDIELADADAFRQGPQRVAPVTGPYAGSLLIREEVGEQNRIALLASVAPGTSVQLRGVRIDYSQAGSFNVAGLTSTLRAPSSMPGPIRYIANIDYCATGVCVKKGATLNLATGVQSADPKMIAVNAGTSYGFFPVQYATRIN